MIDVLRQGPLLIESLLEEHLIRTVIDSLDELSDSLLLHSAYTILLDRVSEFLQAKRHIVEVRDRVPQRALRDVGETTLEVTEGPSGRAC